MTEEEVARMTPAERAATGRLGVNEPLPLEPRRVRLRKWIRARIRPIFWARSSWFVFTKFANLFDIQDVVWLIATGLIVRGMWGLFGDGYGYIAGGAMLAVPTFVMLLRMDRKGPDK